MPHSSHINVVNKKEWICFRSQLSTIASFFSLKNVANGKESSSHLDSPANGQGVIFLTGLLEFFISEISILVTVSDTSVRYQTVTLWL